MKTLVTGDGPSIDVAYNGVDCAMRALLVAMRQRYGSVRVCETASEVFSSAPGAAMVLRPREDQLEALNLGRPRFEALRLRVVLWCTREAWRAIQSMAPDLYDWRSRSVEVPSEPPWWAIENLLACERAGSNCEWRGAGLDECVSRAWNSRAVQRLDARTEYATLLEQIDAAKEDFIAFEHVTSERELWRVRWALAERKRKTGCALVDVGEGVVSWGWWRLHATPMAWSEAIERLREAGDSEPGLTAGWCGLEPEAIEWAVKERVFGDVYDPTRHASALTRSASSEAAVEEAMSDDALPYSDSAFRLWFDSANRLRLNDVVVHAFSRAFVAFDTKDSLWWLADTLMNQGMFEDAIAIANRLEIEFSSSLRSDARLRSLLTALRATARLTLGRYREVIDDPNARIDLRLAAIARSFDSSALTKVVEIGLGPIFGDGPTELAITFPGAMPLEVPESPFDWLRLEAIGSHMIHEKPSYLLGELPLRALFGAYEYRLALTHLAASRALLRYSFTEQALEHAVLARTRFLSLFGPSHHFVGRAYLAEGRALFARGEWSSARDTFALAIASLDASVGPDHPDAHEARFEHAWTRRFLREEDTTASLRAHYAAIITRVPETHPRLRSLAERIDLPSDLAFLPKSTLEADP